MGTTRGNSEPTPKTAHEFDHDRRETVFGGDDVKAQHLAVALGVHADRDHHGDVDDATAFADSIEPTRVSSWQDR
jgi:hypothetical protein